MTTLHKEILTKEQKELLPLVRKFYKDFGLVGGTAIALHIGHRESVDFDLFSFKEFKNVNIRKRILRNEKIDRVIRDEADQFTFIINGVLFTFFCYPFEINYEVDFDKTFKIPSLLTLASMKIFALGRRAKWKDYVDLYFIIKDFHPLSEIIQQAEKIFGDEFNEKICREQLLYFNDINYSGEINYKKGFEVKDEVVKRGLINFSLGL
ncbi:nucleotidyl transferase AbiEii/AbiGii toxin family protein [Patescibacteria group bacterium]|nr:nucleotidyl transferase AbiEii/AbiGii toxin family protein [Patescibacteria group bacterium]MBU4082726.1 nucleotidyl transferase AbiEii/AbiGii toxin family protein [Patescibacteria group bacterium]MCG2809692.1 nucleotidyl transferase AbiEii/AbiGii toxin family protein [Candidatus Portnoybacteria bacterium]